LVPFSIFTPLLVAKKLTERIVIGFLFGAVALVTTGLFLIHFNVSSIKDALNILISFSQLWAIGGSQQELTLGLQDLNSIIMFVPMGAFTALFRPLPGEVPNLFGFCAGIENLLLLLLTVYVLIRFIYIKYDRLNILMICFFVSILIIWAVIYGFVSYQNLGTAFRFKVQTLPFLIMIWFFSAIKPGRILKANNWGLGHGEPMAPKSSCL
jgi:hypothetical protein